MKEMIKKVRERREGFTMAELLIVVAIIAVLVAIAIPVFTTQLNKANAATDAANIRSGYADATTKVLTKEITTNEVYLKKDGTVSATASDLYTTKGVSGDVENDATIGGLAIGSDASWTKGNNIKYTIGSDGVTKISNKS